MAMGLRNGLFEEGYYDPQPEDCGKAVKKSG